MDVGSLRPNVAIYIVARSSIHNFQDKYAFKLFNPWDIDLSHLEREIKMMLLAGDCSIQPLGRIFSDGKIMGFLMPYERSVVPPSSDPLHVPLVDETLSRTDRIDIINQLSTLVSRLHEKGIIHGDIKPANLLLCSDGKLKLCDFAEAKLEGEIVSGPREDSIRYMSPFSMRNFLTPKTKAEDLYATGISIWQIYTGRIPFDYTSEEPIVEDMIRAGIRPDIAAVDDATIAQQILTYLTVGDQSPPDVFPQPSDACLTTEHSFAACIATPRHTYKRTLRCQSCISEALTSPCPYAYSVPTVERSPDHMICPVCHPVEYVGFAF